MSNNDDNLNLTKLAVETTIPDDTENENPESRFECPICLSWLRDPLLTSCGHKFCSECIYNWLKKKNSNCPVDNKPLNKEKDLFVDLFTRREISQQRTKCPNQEHGCDVELSPIEIDKHLITCQYKKNMSTKLKIYCSFKDVGCDDSFDNDKDMQKHIQENNQHHLMIMVKTLSELRTSNNSSTSKVFDSSHWDAPPKNCDNKNDNPQSQQLLKNLYERIVILEQQNRQLSINFENINKKLLTLQTSIRFNDDELSSRYCNGHYIWRLNNFNDKLKDMIAGPLNMFYSPGFYTEPNGYKLCARINISKKDSNYLSVVLHMMQSFNDDALEWPFDGVLVFTLVHPNDYDKSIREETMSQKDLEAFQKPSGDLNKRSFGYTEFVSINELNNFIRNDDCLIFTIQVKTKFNHHHQHSSHDVSNVLD
ncbi:hypothetical protein HCN44_010822 [Aphidius gifuensis]|uniref:Uncharacterized protein n=1 Tax=Aphidius gifuensis TaxID=684658 RepID=A0A834XUS7_APHGI|nr:TNF receptor-associated factor 6 [Aphidius gifuensis]KAF7992002.1 hypothetical protein HCN44_010822 [Aphidius gifuensis]